MKPNFSNWIARIRENSWAYWALFGFISLVLFYQAVFYAHQQPAQLDEGAFMVKGYYFVTGQYKPFQEYGFWTNKMPLSFYIPGLAQVFIGNGLKIGRYFSIFLLFLSVAPIWALLVRLKGKWWALVGLLAMALNPTFIMTYVKANSQVVVVLFLAWSLFFLLGDERKPWQVGLGAALSAMVVLTRQNMVFILPCVIMYAFWLHGKRAGWAAMAGAGIPMLVTHALFFPGIIGIWMEWAPAFVRRFIQYKVVEGGGSGVWNPEPVLLDRISSFFMAVRYHFFSLMGTMLGTALLFDKRAWKNGFERRMIAALTLLFFFLFAIHAWAALGKDYCVFCFPGYVSFFILIGLVIAIVSLSNFVEKRLQIPNGVAIGAILIILPLIFLGSLDTVGRWILDLPAPRFKGGKILPGWTELGTLFENRFQMEYEQLIVTVPLLFGLSAAIMVVAVSWVVHRFTIRKTRQKLGSTLVSVFFILILIFTPTPLLGHHENENNCGGDFVASNEAVGNHLAQIIPPGASVYWGAGSVVTPLAYLTHTKLHPPQLNGAYSYRKGGERELLEKDGFYNEESLRAWRETDDFFLISMQYFNESWRKQFETFKYQELEPTVPLNPCRPETAIRIFERVEK